MEDAEMAYQVKATCGYEIVVSGKGESAPCHISDSNGQIVYRGTYAECVTWLNRRAVTLLG
jgi:hypothetical protein